MPANYIRSSIGRRLAAATIAVGLLVSVLVTAGQLWGIYQSDSAAAQQTLNDIGKTIVPSVSDSLWNVDMERVDSLLNGIAKAPGVAYVRLQSSDGDLIERGHPVQRALRSRAYPLSYGHGRRIDLGTLEVQLNDEPIVQRMARRAVAIAITTFATMGVTLLLILMLFRYWVTRHLETMANYAAQLNFQKLQTPLVLKGKHPHDPPDELERVVLSLNRMREALLDEMEVQKQTETELELHRNHLAEIVRARTAALNEKTKELEEQKKAISLLANTDVLTGVYTRRYFYDLAKLEISRSWRSGEPLSLLLLDIDFFKQVNDEHGHAVGDAALIAMAGVFKATLRDFDVVGRMGGEEFAVLLAGNDLERARLAAERLRLAVSEASLLVGERALSLTVSVGVTALATPDQDVDSLLKIADDALYQAKREGRNRVVVGN